MPGQSKNPYDKLKLRRQYILAPQKNAGFNSWKHIDLNNSYHLFVHPELNLSIKTNNNLRIILLGNIFDYKNQKFSNDNILNSLFTDDFNHLLRLTDSYSGRYIIIFIRDKDFKIFHDPSASRKIYFSNKDNKVWCASQPHILSKLLGFEITPNIGIQNYYNSKEFLRLESSGILDITIFDEIKQLLPNHYLDITNRQIIRYWPCETLEKINIKDAASIAAQMLRGFIENANNRYDLMIPVTAGADSRSLAAASKNISDSVFYYINKNPWTDEDCNDIKIPSRLFKKINIKFSILEYSQNVDSEFKKVYFNNNMFASEKYLPSIYNYYLNFEDKINLPATFIAIAKNFFHTFEKNITGEILAKLNGISNHEIAIDAYSNWLKTSYPVCKKYNINILDLFYWEERMGNWGTQIQVDKDIAHEEFMPYNSRKLITTLLGVDKKYRLKPDHILIKTIIKNLWPELLSEPMNPSFKSKVKSILRSLKLYNIVERINKSIKGNN